jgi:hypothetical protein
VGTSFSGHGQTRKGKWFLGHLSISDGASVERGSEDKYWMIYPGRYRSIRSRSSDGQGTVLRDTLPVPILQLCENLAS